MSSLQFVARIKNREDAKTLHQEFDKSRFDNSWTDPKHVAGGEAERWTWRLSLPDEVSLKAKQASPGCGLSLAFPGPLLFRYAWRASVAPYPTRARLGLSPSPRRGTAACSRVEGYPPQRQNPVLAARRAQQNPLHPRQGPPAKMRPPPSIENRGRTGPVCSRKRPPRGLGHAGQQSHREECARLHSRSSKTSRNPWWVVEVSGVFPVRAAIRFR